LAIVTTATTTATTLLDPEEPVDEVPPPELITEPPVPIGVPFGRIEIDKIGLDAVLFEGVDRDTLKLSPGHMPDTPLPGQPGNAVVSGHRTTYGRPFFDVDQLVVGDTIDVETALGMSTYAIRQILVVAPTDVWVTDPIEGAWLTLTTCNPKFSAAERLIIQAELVGGPNLDYVQAMTATAARPAA
jgi:sortase A